MEEPQTQEMYLTSCCKTRKPISVLTIGYLNQEPRIICTDCFPHASEAAPQQVRDVAAREVSHKRRLTELISRGRNLGIVAS